VTYNRTLGNLFGDDDQRFVNLFGIGNNFGSNVADGVSLFLGLIGPSALDQCRSKPEDFLATVDKWNILRPNGGANSLDISAFTKLTANQFACVLNFKNDYIEVAQLGWAFKELFLALQLRSTVCPNR
jgi:hypothetical protein